MLQLRKMCSVLYMCSFPSSAQAMTSSLMSPELLVIINGKVNFFRWIIFDLLWKMTGTYNYETGYIKQILQGRKNVEICT